MKEIIIESGNKEKNKISSRKIALEKIKNILNNRLD